MKAKKLILLFFLCATHIFDAGIVRHTLISVAEQKVMGHTFKHIMTSGGAQKDEFFIDTRMVKQDDYEQEFDRLLKKEQEEELALQQKVRRNRIEFADMMQIEITVKLLNKILVQIDQLLAQIYNPALEKFFVFNNGTIHSVDQLMQVKAFTEQLDESIQTKIEDRDCDGLHVLYSKLEYWPARLEKFFQDTVQNAIKKSDDTMMLKELLKLVSESSLLT